MRSVTDSIELAEALSGVDVLEAEYTRLLGYPRGVELEGRARELAHWARECEARAAVDLCAAGGKLRHRRKLHIYGWGAIYEQAIAGDA